jgi:integrase
LGAGPWTVSGFRTGPLPCHCIIPVEARSSSRYAEEIRQCSKLSTEPEGGRSRLHVAHANNIRYRDHYPRLTRLKLPRIRPHDLRHGHASHLVAAGVDHRTVADRVGHSSPSFTRATYVHGVSEAQRRAAEVASTLLALSRPKEGAQ